MLGKARLEVHAGGMDKRQNTALRSFGAPTLANLPRTAALSATMPSLRRLERAKAITSATRLGTATERTVMPQGMRETGHQNHDVMSWPIRSWIANAWTGTGMVSRAVTARVVGKISWTPNLIIKEEALDVSFP